MHALRGIPTAAPHRGSAAPFLLVLLGLVCASLDVSALSLGDPKRKIATSSAPELAPWSSPKSPPVYGRS